MKNSSATVAVVGQPPPAIKHGWMWKYSTGRSLMGRKNWKLRYFICSTEGISYYATEPFENPKNTIPWEDVTHLYDVNTLSLPGIEAEEGKQPQQHCFGLRFHCGDAKKELVLGMRSDDLDEAKLWVESLRRLRQEYERLCEVIKEDERDDDDAVGGDLPDNQPLVAKKGFMAHIQTRLRNLVSLKKQRYVKDGLDLDMAYILPNVIAMGYPAEGREAMFRNPMDHVVSLFEKYHKGHYKIYNLCSERSYPPNRFGGNFARFPFDDHNTSPMELLLRICEDIFTYLNADTITEIPTTGKGGLKTPLDAAQKKPANVVSIHCKAGKGRTGLVICCYLLYTGMCQTADEALKVFGDRRTKDGKGVQIPSQRRYITYFEQLIHTYHGCIPRSYVFLKQIVLTTTPKFDADGGSDPFALVKVRSSDHCHKGIGHLEGNVAEPYVTVSDSRNLAKPTHVVNKLNVAVPLNVATGPDDIKIVLFDEDTGRNELMCAFWVHCGFLPHNPDGVGSVAIPKMCVDDAVRDTSHKAFTEDFMVRLEYLVESSETVIAPAFTVPALLDVSPPSGGAAGGLALGDRANTNNSFMINDSFGSLGRTKSERHRMKSSSPNVAVATSSPDDLI